MTKDKEKKLLDLPPFTFDAREKQQLLLNEVIEELQFHYCNNDLYQRFCKKSQFDPFSEIRCVEDIPAIPVSVFKALGERLNSVPSDQIRGKLQSSATSGIPSTILMDKLTISRQRKAMTRVISDVIGGQKKQFWIMDVPPTNSHADVAGARRAAITGYMNFASSHEYFMQYEMADADISLNVDKLLRCFSLLNPDEPVVVFGFTFLLYEKLIKTLIEEKHRLTLPRGSMVIHIGGWKKLENRRVSKTKFNNDTANALGVPLESIRDIYGFTEQMGLNYPDCEAGWKHVPAYTHLVVRDEATHAVLPPDQIGLLHFITPITHSYPGNSVVTDDLGYLSEGQCECGLATPKFKIIGRAKKAEVRGCGEVLADKVKTTPMELPGGQTRLEGLGYW